LIRVKAERLFGFPKAAAAGVYKLMFLSLKRGGNTNVQSALLKQFCRSFAATNCRKMMKLIVDLLRLLNSHNDTKAFFKRTG
jgi:hypothetical protein